MRSFIFSSSSKQPYSLLSKELPISLNQIPDEITKLPQEYQNQETYNEIVQEDHRLILKEFESLIKYANKRMPDSLDSASKQEIVQAMTEGLRDHEKGTIYANAVEKYGRSRLNSETKNSLFYKLLLNQILDTHADRYNIVPVTDQYYDIIDVRQQTHKPAFLCCFSSKRSPNGNRRQEEELLKGLKAERNVKNLRNQMNAARNNKKPMQKQEISNVLGTQIASTIFSPPQNNNKFHYNSSNIEKLLVAQQFSAPKQIIADGDTSRLSFYNFHTTHHFMKFYTPEIMHKIQKNPYLSTGFNYIKVAIQNLQVTKSQNNQFTPLCQKIISQLNNARTPLQNSGQEGIYHELQSWIILIIHIYKSVEHNYDSYRRRNIKQIIDVFRSKDFPHPVQVLRWLENHRKQIILLNTTQTIDQLISKSGALMFDVHNNRKNFLQEHDVQAIPKISLVHLSSKQLPRRKTVNILVSGFLSEDMAKDAQWQQLIQYMPDSQFYGLQWQSNKIINLIKFMGKSCKDLLTGGAIQDQLKKKFQDNPFIPAFQTAKYTGRYLAQLLVRLFPQQFINIAGYSLGSQVIKQFLQRMIQINAQHKISNIVMMGGVSDIQQLAGIIKTSKYPLCISNCYTDNDMVLKHILSKCKPQHTTVGLNKIPECPGHDINNVDVSDVISGHLSYMTQFDIVGKIVDMEKE